MTSAWVVWSVVALLLGGLEWRRPDRRHRWPRVLVVAAAVAAAVALVSPPMVPGATGESGTVILVTPGATAENRAAAQEGRAGVPVVTWPDSVADLDLLQLRFPALRRLVVAGWGLRAAWWEGHEALEVVAVPAPSPSGFRLLEAPDGVRLGERARFVARLEGSADSLAFLELPGGVVDTIRVDPGQAGLVRFEVTPKAAGTLQLVLAAISVPPETLQVAVAPPVSPAVLVLEGAPSFETTFLRRWLAGQGGRMAIRTRLSLDRDREERVNAPGLPLQPVTPALLAEFDLVIVDGSTVRRFAAGERATLLSAIREAGLGLLVLPDSQARGDREFFPFRLASTGDGEDRRVRPRWVGAPGRSTTAVPTAALEILTAPGQADLLQDPVGRILAASVRRGAGRIGTTLVLAPSRWQLEGDTVAYADYWSRIHASLARGRGEEWVVAADGPLVPDHGFDLGLVTDDPSPRVEARAPDGSVDTVGMAQELADPSRWWGRFWPRMPGWHRATNHAGATYPFHVAEARLSPSEADARLRATAARAALPPPEAPAGSGATHRPLPPLIPFLVLVAMLAALWAEGRGLWNTARSRITTDR